MFAVNDDLVQAETPSLSPNRHGQVKKKEAPKKRRIVTDIIHTGSHDNLQQEQEQEQLYLNAY